MKTGSTQHTPNNTIQRCTLQFSPLRTSDDFTTGHFIYLINLLLVPHAFITNNLSVRMLLASDCVNVTFSMPCGNGMAIEVKINSIRILQTKG